MNLCDGGIREQYDWFLQNRSTRAMLRTQVHDAYMYKYMFLRKWRLNIRNLLVAYDEARVRFSGVVRREGE